MAKCGYTIFDNEVVVEKGLFRTGDNKAKGKKPDVEYFDTVEEQIHHICVGVETLVNNHKPDHYVFEALSFGSTGNATRNLAQLYGALMETLISRMEIDISDVTSYAPTSLKSYARRLLPTEEQFDGYTKAGKPKLIKMDKKLMVKAAESVVGVEYFKGYNFSTGKDDLADSFLLGHKYITENC